MPESADTDERTTQIPESVRLLIANTDKGVLSRIWYDRDDGRELTMRIVEPKLLVHGTDGLLVFAFQVEPSRGVRHFVATRISRVEADELPLMSQSNRFSTGDVLMIRPAGPVAIDPPNAPADAYHAYLAAVREVVSDLLVEDWEMAHVEQIRRRGDLTDDQVRAAHATVFAEYLLSYARDGEVDESESTHLGELAAGLEKLGWRPG